jgi:threonine efflux protein
MNSYNLDLLANLMIVHMIATMSPGPNFMLVFQKSLEGIPIRCLGALVLGVGLGSIVHSSLALLGVNAMLQQSPAGFQVLRLVGGGYLAYLGYKSLTGFVRSRRLRTQTSLSKVPVNAGRKEVAPLIHFARSGFLASILNPKSLLYFSSVLPQFLSADVSRVQLLSTPPILCLITCLWFGGVSLVVTLARHQPLVLRGKDYLSLVVGLLFVWLATSQFFEFGQQLLKA